MMVKIGFRLIIKLDIYLYIEGFIFLFFCLECFNIGNFCKYLILRYKVMIVLFYNNGLFL